MRSKANKFSISNGIIVAILLIISISVNGQEFELEKTITELQELLTTVEANKTTYNQELKTISPGNYQYSVVEVDTKGNEKESNYYFSLSDINQKSVKSFTKKDLILIEIPVSSKQKMVKKIYSEGEKQSYISSFQMYALTANNGREIVARLKEGIPFSVELDQKSLALNSYEDHFNWLKENVSNIELDKKEIRQQFSTSELGSGLATFAFSKGEKEEQLELNLSLLNEKSINYKISGNVFSVEVSTKNDVKSIKHFEDNILNNYQNDIVLFANSAENGKKIYKVLQRIIPLAKEEFDKFKPKISSSADALKYINEQIADIPSSTISAKQNITLENDGVNLVSKETKDAKENEFVYNFDFADISKSAIQLKSKKDILFLELVTSKGENYINSIKDGELQNYTKKMMLYFNTINEAIICKELLELLIKNRLKSLENETTPTYSLSEAIDNLQEHIVTVEREEDSFDQQIEILNADDKSIKFVTTLSTPKKVKTTTFEFSAQDINWKKTELKVSGKRVWVLMQTKNSKKVIKTFEEGQVENYENEIEIETLNINNARDIIKIFNEISEE